jgi:hypothetical protein
MSSRRLALFAQAPFATVLLGGILLSGGACHRAPEQRLQDVKVPAGFTFASTRPVQVSVTAAESALPARGSARLEIAQADGKLLYRGRAAASTPLTIKLGLPLADAHLVATLYASDGVATHLTLPILGSAASGSFQ